jgi:hypothetical protein
MPCSIIKLVANFNEFVESHAFNYRWINKKVHIQGVVFFQERAIQYSMPSLCKNTTTRLRRTSAVDGTF